jgi:hypothetical protein
MEHLFEYLYKIGDRNNVILVEFLIATISN